MIFAFLGPLNFHIIFRINLTISAKKFSANLGSFQQLLLWIFFLLLSCIPLLLVFPLHTSCCTSGVPHFSEPLIIFPHYIFPLFFGLLISIILALSLLILMIVQIYHWASLMNFLFQLLYFTTPELLFGFIYNF